MKKKLVLSLHHLIFSINFISMFSLLADVFSAPNNLLVGAQIVYRRMEGEELTIKCLFNFEGIAKVFCKDPCDVANSLFWLPIQGTTGGPVNFQFTGSQTRSEVSVTFRRLTKADSALYTCGLIGQFQRSQKQVAVVVNGEFPNLALTVIRFYGGTIIFAALQCLTGSRYIDASSCVQSYNMVVEVIHFLTADSKVSRNVVIVTQVQEVKLTIQSVEHSTLLPVFSNLCLSYSFGLLVLSFFTGLTGRRQNPQMLTTTTAQAGSTTEFTTAEQMSDTESKSSASLSLSPWLPGSGLAWVIYLASQLVHDRNHKQAQLFFIIRQQPLLLLF